ncbi:hypothetical protein [Microbacterium sp.]|uniref:hypothetical protein n=1 Tax=Microbacterium sp. TaxID=51671 RepID=UPI0039E6E2D6
MARNSRVARLVCGTAALSISLILVGCGVVDDTLHRSEGSRATATCERRLQLGPS